MGLIEDRTGTLERYILQELCDQVRSLTSAKVNGDVLESFQLLLDNVSSEKVSDVIVAYFQEERFTLIGDNTPDFTFQKGEEKLKVCLNHDNTVMGVSLIKIQ